MSHIYNLLPLSITFINPFIILLNLNFVIPLDNTKKNIQELYINFFSFNCFKLDISFSISLHLALII